MANENAATHSYDLGSATPALGLEELMVFSASLV